MRRENIKTALSIQVVCIKGLFIALIVSFSLTKLSAQPIDPNAVKLFKALAPEFEYCDCFQLSYDGLLGIVSKERLKNPNAVSIADLTGAMRFYTFLNHASINPRFEKLMKNIVTEMTKEGIKTFSLKDFMNLTKAGHESLVNKGIIGDFYTIETILPIILMPLKLASSTQETVALSVQEQQAIDELFY